ncbi:thioredoxin, partial [Campylobacter sp. BCW_8712]
MKIKKILLLVVISCLFVACSNDKEKQQNDVNLSTEASINQSDDMNFKLNLIDGGSISVKKENAVLNFNDEDKATLFVFFT